MFISFHEESDLIEMLKKNKNNELFISNGLVTWDVLGIIKWFDENCKGRVIANRGSYCFELKEDRDNFLFYLNLLN